MAVGDVQAAVLSIDARPCANFDGVDDSIAVAKGSGYLNTIKTEGSFSFWVKIKKLASVKAALECGIDYAGTGTNGAIFFMSNANDTFRFQVGTGASTKNASTQTAIVKDTWTHICGTIGNNVIRIYLNGVAKQTQTDAGFLINPSATASVGFGRQIGGGMLLEGCLRDVQIFNRELTQAEITKLSTHQSVTDGLIGKWLLSGDTTDSIGATPATTTGATFVTHEQNIQLELAARRVGATDKYFVEEGWHGQIFTAHINES